VFDHREHEVLSLLNTIDSKLTSFLNQQQILETKVMSALTDVQGALAQVTADVGTLITLAEAGGTAAGGIAPADAEAIVANLQALDAQVQSAITAAGGTVAAPAA
jgi:hypothetical protein